MASPLVCVTQGGALAALGPRTSLLQAIQLSLWQLHRAAEARSLVKNINEFGFPRPKPFCDSSGAHCSCLQGTMSLPAKTSKMAAGKKGKSAEDESQPSKEEPGADLAAMFHQGDNQIERRRQVLQLAVERKLPFQGTGQRVELQRKLFQEFEKRERQRKVRCMASRLIATHADHLGELSCIP